jgi:CRISPR-associated protein Csh2
MTQTINNRSEILFLYDVSWSNPNGDPVDENKPRIDEETNRNIVTDVRLKRTVRDYLHDYRGLDIFIKEIRVDNKKLVTKENRMEQFKNQNEEVIKQCIDIRLFGATIAIKDFTLALTGPVQFKFGKSLHRIVPAFVKGTTVMPSGEDRTQGTFTERYVLPYSLIAFYGVVNEKATQNQGYSLATDQDIQLLLEALWNGTKNLISVSKAGHQPRMLVWIQYQPDKYHIGELDNMIQFVHEKRDEEIRSINEGTIEINQLVQALQKRKNEIHTFGYQVDDQTKLTMNGENTTFPELFSDYPLKPFHF